MKKQDSPGPEKVWEKAATMRRRANPAAETFIFPSDEGCQQEQKLWKMQLTVQQLDLALF